MQRHARPWRTIWFGFGAAFVDKTGCKNSRQPGYAVGAGRDKHFTQPGRHGPPRQLATPRTRTPALAYVKWFESKDTQLAWAKLGGFSARKSVLASDTFKNAAPYNPAFADAYQYVKDFWNIPEYNAMLQTADGEPEPGRHRPEGSEGRRWTTIATKQQSILDEAYPNGPPK